MMKKETIFIVGKNYYMYPNYLLSQAVRKANNGPTGHITHMRINYQYSFMKSDTKYLHSLVMNVWFKIIFHFFSHTLDTYNIESILLF